MSRKHFGPRKPPKNQSSRPFSSRPGGEKSRAQAHDPLSKGKRGQGVARPNRSETAKSGKTGSADWSKKPGKTSRGPQNRSFGAKSLEGSFEDRPRREQPFKNRAGGGRPHRASQRQDERHGTKPGRAFNPLPANPSSAVRQNLVSPAPASQGQKPVEARKKYKRSEDSNWIYGLHSVRAALENPVRRCHRLVLSENSEKDLATLATARRLNVQVTDARALDALLPRGAVHQGVALQADPLPDADIEDLIASALSTSGPLICLDQLNDPHNVGAILRSAAVFGAAGLIMLERHAPHLSGALAKAASGALEVVPIARVTNLARALEEIAKNDIFIIGLDEDGDTDMSAIGHRAPCALVLGAEGEGLRRLSRENCNVIARLPARGSLKSLNVSNAAAVALYEMTRQIQE